MKNLSNQKVDNNMPNKLKVHKNCLKILKHFFNFCSLMLLRKEADISDH